MGGELKGWLSYRGHQLFQMVTWSKLVQALHKLKHSHPQYVDIIVRDWAEPFDSALSDEDYDAEDETMDNQNEDYLMEIDSFESSAINQTENDPENGEQNTDMLPLDSQLEEQTDDGEQEGDILNDEHTLESCLQLTDVSEEILCLREGIYSIYKQLLLAFSEQVEMTVSVQFSELQLSG